MSETGKVPKVEWFFIITYGVKPKTMTTVSAKVYALPNATREQVYNLIKEVVLLTPLHIVNYLYLEPNKVAI